MMPIDVTNTMMPPPAPRKPRRRRAFTIVELMTVLTFVAILAALAIPRFAGSIRRQRADAAANRIVADLRLAQRHARIASVSQTVQFYPSQLRYELVGLANPNRPSETYTADLSQTPYEISALSVDCGGDSVLTYDMYGMPDSGGTIVVWIGNETRTITIEASTGEAGVSE